MAKEPPKRKKNSKQTPQQRMEKQQRARKRRATQPGKGFKPGPKAVPLSSDTNRLKFQETLDRAKGAAKVEPGYGHPVRGGHTPGMHAASQGTTAQFGQKQTPEEFARQRFASKMQSLGGKAIPPGVGKKPSQAGNPAYIQAVRETIYETLGEYGNKGSVTPRTKEKGGPPPPYLQAAADGDDALLGAVDRLFANPDRVFGAQVKVTRETRDQLHDKKLGRINSTEAWRNQRGTFASGSPPLEESISGPPRRKGKGVARPNEYMSQISESEKAFIESEMRREGSPLYGATTRSARDVGRNKLDSASYRNLQNYIGYRQDEWSQEDIYSHLQKETRGRKPATKSTGKSAAYKSAKERVDKRGEYPQKGGRKTKTEIPDNTHGDFLYSKQAPRISTPGELRKDNPDASEADIARMRDLEREVLTDEVLERNSAWQSEERARQMGTSPGSEGDKVTVFTTSLGAPSVAVSSKSFLGQYVIKKRKKMVVDDKQNTRYEVKGSFPNAVRDKHIIEAGSGVSLGAQGQYGFYKNTGVRRGTKRSKGYGMEVPVGATLVRDAWGQPVYDKDGNPRYTEGYTRPFATGTTQSVGFRIFVG